MIYVILLSFVAAFALFPGVWPLTLGAFILFTFVFWDC